MLRIVIASSMGLLYTMANTLQVFVCFGLVSLPMASNVYMILNEVTALAGFELMPPDMFIAAMFPNFTETNPVNSSFYEMEADSRTLVPYLGFFFIGMLGTLI